LRNSEKALEYAKKARSLAPNDAEVAKLAGHAAYQGGDYTWAYSLLQDVGRRPGAGAEVLFDIAWTAYYLGKNDEARKTMQQALDAAPDGPAAAKAREFLKLTSLLDTPDGWTEKESAVQAMLKEDAGNVPALMLQGALQQQQKQTPGAVATYNAILARLPNFSPAQKQLAAIYLEQPDRFDAAFDMATKARKNLPDDPEVAQILAVLRYQRKEFASVIQLLQESAARRPLTARHSFYLGMSQLQSKQNTEGYKALEQALESGLGEPQAGEARQVLAKRPK
jgi:tetratricopeptide (TPR) repeat protein